MTFEWNSKPNNQIAKSILWLFALYIALVLLTYVHSALHANASKAPVAATLKQASCSQWLENPLRANPLAPWQYWLAHDYWSADLRFNAGLKSDARCEQLVMSQLHLFRENLRMVVIDKNGEVLYSLSYKP